jgi:hypothetical protein
MALFKNRKTNKLEDLNGSYGAYKAADASPGHRLNPNLSGKEQMNNGTRVPGVNRPNTSADYNAKQDQLARVKNTKVPGVKAPESKGYSYSTTHKPGQGGLENPPARTPGA